MKTFLTQTAASWFLYAAFMTTTAFAGGPPADQGCSIHSPPNCGAGICNGVKSCKTAENPPNTCECK